MAKLKYADVKDVPETDNLPVGTYRFKIISAEDGKSKSSDADMTTITLQATHDASGKKLGQDYWPLRVYLMTADDRDYAKRRIKEFMEALGVKTLDTDKSVGKVLLGRVKSGKDLDDEYRPEIGKLMKYTPSDEAPEDDEPADEPEAEAEAEPEDEGVDLGPMSRDELKKFIKDNELGSLADLGINKKTTDDEIRDIIVEAMGGDEEPETEAEDEEPEPEDETEPEAEAEAGAEPDGDGETYTGPEWTVPALRAELKERELPTNGGKAALVARLVKDDTDQPF